MELTQAIHRYNNRIIRSDELLKELSKYDTTNLSGGFKKMMDKIILDIKNIQKTATSEVDEIEINRRKILIDVLNHLKRNKKNDPMVIKEINEIKEELNLKRDSGELHNQITELIATNILIKLLINKINDKELLEIVTEPFFVFNTIKISTVKFNDLVNLAIKNNSKEQLKKIVFDYSNAHDISIIWDYFIEIRDVDCLIDLIRLAEDGAYLEKLFTKISSTNDEEFINKLDLKLKKYELYSTEEERLLLFKI